AILLESARFDPRSNRHTSRRHGIGSESSYRYQRGIDPEVTDWASRRACELILELAGGTLLKGSADLRADSTLTPELVLRLARLKLVLGLEVPRSEIVRIFKGLQLLVLHVDDEAVRVRVPSWRGDLRREIDLIEEVARIYGYDKIGETTEMPVRAVSLSAQEQAERRVRRLLAGCGFHEVMTYSLVSTSPIQLAQPWGARDPIAVRNPVTVDRTHLRVTNMANLLGVKQFNQARGTGQVNLFELGRIYLPRTGEKLPAEKLCLTLLGDGEDGLRRLKGILANVCDELGIEAPVEESPGVRGPFQEGESVELHLEGELLGCAGRASGEAAEQFDLTSRPALMELDFHRLLRRCGFDRPYRPVPAYPATSRDLAVVVDEDVLWLDVARCVQESPPETLESVELLDVYRGEPVPTGRKSVAFSLTFRRSGRTITAEDAEQGRSAILEALREKLGAELR
ncbi:MAG: phenylalanine--tRNA ligase subunit beta, partial [Planctomycetota bacterium]